MCKRRALRSYVITMGAGVYTFGVKLCIHIGLLSFSAVREWRENMEKALVNGSGCILLGAGRFQPVGVRQDICCLSCSTVYSYYSNFSYNDKSQCVK